MAVTTSHSELLPSLKKHNDAFTSLLSLIPAKYYIVQASTEDADTKWMKNKKKRPVEEVKEGKKKAKREKLDPENQKTVPEILAAAAPAPSSAPLQPMAPSASIAALRSKLHAKLESFRSRGVAAADNDDMESRDELEDSQRKRRGEMRDRRRTERKEERRREAEKGKPKPKPAVAGADKGKAKDVSVKPGKTSLFVPALPPLSTEDGGASVPESNITFPSIALPSSSSHKTSKHALKQLSNPAQALAHLDKHKEKLANLPEEKRKEIEERERWEKAEMRAGGEKVRDEEKALLKAAKRIDKEKQKGRKEWTDRKIAAQASQAAKIKKRNDNIATRAEARRNKRLGIKPKGGADKGKAGGNKKPYKGKPENKRPGFEGGRTQGEKKGGDKKGGKK